MKNIILFVLFILAIVFFQFTTAQSVDDIINQYITARGGIDKLNSIQSIYLEGTRQMMGSEVEVKVIKVEGKLFRTDFEFGGNHGYTIVTPDKGWSYIPMRSDKPNEIPAPVLKSMQTQLDIAGPLVNYKSKGYQAELKGKENINGNDAYNIQLTSADGKNINYYIDTKTSLLVQTRQMSEGGRNGGGQPKEIVTNFKDYTEVNGIKFPQTIVTEGEGMGGGAMTFDKIEINVPVDEKMYKPGN
ncbi:MAG: outer membrane lipoprotein-sorting protein [Ginsengibacter sp.]